MKTQTIAIFKFHYPSHPLPFSSHTLSHSLSLFLSFTVLLSFYLSFYLSFPLFVMFFSSSFLSSVFKPAIFFDFLPFTLYSINISPLFFPLYFVLLFASSSVSNIFFHSLNNHLCRKLQQLNEKKKRFARNSFFSPYFHFFTYFR